MIYVLLLIGVGFGIYYLMGYQSGWSRRRRGEQWTLIESRDTAKGTVELHQAEDGSWIVHMVPSDPKRSYPTVLRFKTEEKARKSFPLVRF